MGRRGVRPGARGREHVAMFYSRRTSRPKLLDGGVQRGAAKGHLEHEEIQRGKLGNCKVTGSHSHTTGKICLVQRIWSSFTTQLKPPVSLYGFLQPNVRTCVAALGPKNNHYRDRSPSAWLMVLSHQRASRHREFSRRHL
jgi:hypothetical protein